MDPIRIGTRGSELALWQANHVAARLREAAPGLEVELVIIKTTGDRITDRPLAEVGGKGLFVKEIEEALLDGGVDLAVHSLKDVPAELPPGLELCSYPGRESPFDALCGREPLGSLADLRRGARVGTGSERRGAQLLAARPDLEIVPIRGNVPTRLARRDGADGLDAVVLAEAGLRRLGRWERGFLALQPPDVIPAPAQGILALEARIGDARVAPLAAALDVATARRAAAIERACLRAVGGDCHTPFGALADTVGGGLTLIARLFDDSGRAHDLARVVPPDADLAGAARVGAEVGAALRALAG
ncbi:MAG: hydroxymethylbilane synthase [Myxococcales bacterium]|nr:hydroxymethylbilane synthase [Myxococcales bacterium]MCB9520074.1 hydroxymethylbilane synthase [Myxococcales bacterium]MCB9531800.1 hydroxymethylbilane synthase [Myxococcales bacterium]